MSILSSLHVYIKVKMNHFLFLHYFLCSWENLKNNNVNKYQILVGKIIFLTVFQ